MSSQLVSVAAPETYINQTTTIRVNGRGQSSYPHLLDPNFHQVQLRLVLVPILSCIFGFPVLVLLIICGLRFRAKRARKLANKRIERPTTTRDRGPTILINGCENEQENIKSENMYRDCSKLKQMTVRFKPLVDLDQERSEMDMELTSEFILTPDESSATLSS